MRTTDRSPPTSARNVSPDQPPAIGVREEGSMTDSLLDVEQAWPHPAVRVERRTVDEAESRQANGPDWDRYADEYQATHGPFLGDVGFVWGPEGVTEADAGALGAVRDRDVLEVGSGAGQCSRWVISEGGRAIGLDLSHRQLQHSRRIDHETGVPVPAVLGTATDLPFPD